MLFDILENHYMGFKKNSILGCYHIQTNWNMNKPSLMLIMLHYLFWDLI
jgi:hypothetical protein